MARQLCGCPLEQDVDMKPVVEVPTVEKEGSLQNAFTAAGFPDGFCRFDPWPFIKSLTVDKCCTVAE